jgi:hypothetical protein
MPQATVIQNLRENLRTSVTAVREALESKDLPRTSLNFRHLTNEVKEFTSKIEVLFRHLKNRSEDLSILYLSMRKAWSDEKNKMAFFHRKLAVNCTVFQLYFELAVNYILFPTNFLM